jgi:electron transfer flavoprotein alpha subunit
MSKVLVFAENTKGKFKKTTLETVTYGAKVAEMTGATCHVVVIGEAENAGELGVYGAKSVHQIKGSGLDHFDSQVYTDIIARTAVMLGTDIIILSHTATGKSLLGRLSVRLKAGSVAGVNSLPVSVTPFQVRKGVFSGKAIASYEINTPYKVISLSGNSIPPAATGSAVSVENLSLEIPASRIKVVNVKTVEGTVPLPEAEVVVSAGRGMKDPSNWGIVEDLAVALNATTACSRPVADAGWRPHHEHVGQTGIAIRPNLYFAIGISGAIQHLAGVNNSRVIVVINKDPEAPFFKAADYGVCGDLFEILPKLTAAVKRFKHT